MESAVARLWSGARSPTKGSINCGVTVDTAVMKESARKTEKDFVRHRPSHYKGLDCIYNRRYYTYNRGSKEN